jgi:hypothetical protein
VTFGQYMRPTKKHMKVDRYVLPEEFAKWKQVAEDMGFLYVASGPLVRSSYKVSNTARLGDRADWLGWRVLHRERAQEAEGRGGDEGFCRALCGCTRDVVSGVTVDQYCCYMYQIWSSWTLVRLRCSRAASRNPR